MSVFSGFINRLRPQVATELPFLLKGCLWDLSLRSGGPSSSVVLFAIKRLKLDLECETQPIGHTLTAQMLPQELIAVASKAGVAASERIAL
jgi:hypothetical protein